MKIYSISAKYEEPPNERKIDCLTKMLEAQRAIWFLTQMNTKCPIEKYKVDYHSETYTKDYSALYESCKEVLKPTPT